MHAPFILYTPPRSKLRVSRDFIYLYFRSDGTCPAKFFYNHETTGVTVALNQSSDRKAEGAKNILLLCKSSAGARPCHCFIANDELEKIDLTGGPGDHYRFID
jgi:hypothetical protein